MNVRIRIRKNSTTSVITVHGCIGSFMDPNQEYVIFFCLNPRFFRKFAAPAFCYALNRLNSSLLIMFMLYSFSMCFAIGSVLLGPHICYLEIKQKYIFYNPLHCCCFSQINVPTA